jgi:dTDP-4-amino-4,6-dideoxygalactose transaminase
LTNARAPSQPAAEYRIPFNKPGLTGNELLYVAEAIQRGHTAGDGSFTRSCRELLEAELGAPAILLTTSCTHALEMSALLLDTQPGDEVIVPSFTFVSTVNAFVLRGARPVFVDIRPDTLNLDEAQLEDKITPRTKAIVVVHYAGVGCEMNEVLPIARRHGIAVVEDNAHGLFGRYHGRYLGGFGSLATLSFHETKNIVCGEGGALMVNDRSFIERAEIIREKGTNRSHFFRGQVDKYTWVDIGSSFLMSDILAAYLRAQLENRDLIRQRRRGVWERYRAALEGWCAEYNVQFPAPPAHCEQSYHMFYLILPSLEIRQHLIAHLKTRGILSVFHYLPLHLSDMGRRFGGRSGQCPVTERVSDCLLRLPFYNDLSETQQDDVVQAILDFPMPRKRTYRKPGQADPKEASLAQRATSG